MESSDIKCSDLGWFRSMGPSVVIDVAPPLVAARSVCFPEPSCCPGDCVPQRFDAQWSVYKRLRASYCVALIQCGADAKSLFMYLVTLLWMDVPLAHQVHGGFNRRTNNK